jgi:hypothetical protein
MTASTTLISHIGFNVRAYGTNGNERAPWQVPVALVVGALLLLSTMSLPLFNTSRHHLPGCTAIVRTSPQTR